MNDGQFYRLAGIAAVIWDRFEQGADVDLLVDELAERYDIDRDTCREDVQGFCRELVRLGFAERVDLAS